MNSINGPRRHPRRRSFNLRTFFWVLQREAALRVLYPASMEKEQERFARLAVRKARPDHLKHLVFVTMAAHGRQEWYPAPIGASGELPTPAELGPAEQLPLLDLPPASSLRT